MTEVRDIRPGPYPGWEDDRLLATEAKAANLDCDDVLAIIKADSLEAAQKALTEAWAKKEVNPE